MPFPLTEKFLLALSALQGLRIEITDKGHVRINAISLETGNLLLKGQMFLTFRHHLAHAIDKAGCHLLCAENRGDRMQFILFDHALEGETD